MFHCRYCFMSLRVRQRLLTRWKTNTATCVNAVAKSSTVIDKLGPQILLSFEAKDVWKDDKSSFFVRTTLLSWEQAVSPFKLFIGRRQRTYCRWRVDWGFFLHSTNWAWPSTVNDLCAAQLWDGAAPPLVSPACKGPISAWMRFGGATKRVAVESFWGSNISEVCQMFKRTWRNSCRGGVWNYWNKVFFL